MKDKTEEEGKEVLREGENKRNRESERERKSDRKKVMMKRHKEKGSEIERGRDRERRRGELVVIELERDQWFMNPKLSNFINMIIAYVAAAAMR